MKFRIQIASIAIGCTLLAAACSGAPASNGQDAAGKELPMKRTAATKPATSTGATAQPGTTPPTGNANGAGTVLGTTSYPIPSGALVVAPDGNDTNAGTSTAPLRTLARAVAVASPGSTIVMHAGTYHESVMIPAGRTLTIQNWPGETVWLDGSEVVSGWVATGGRWQRPGWNTTFDHSPTYTRGAADNTGANWGFVNSAFPMAAHPDQVWIDGTAQTQVAGAADVAPGSFAKDDTAATLHLGTDPNGHEVRSATLVKALTVRAANTTVRGIGIRRYSPSVPDMGAVTVEAPGVTLEHLVVTDMATTGVSVLSTSATLRNLDVSRSGMLGIHANYADGIRVIGVVARSNNVERFNSSPVSGGLKITRTRGVTVTDSVFRDNVGPGLWADESVYDITITGCDMTGNAGHGTSLELSAKAVFANNLVTSNGGNGIKVNDTSDIALVNNTFIGNNRPVNIVQDARRAANASTPGHDPRQPFPDPTMTWINGPVLVQGNVISAPSAGNCLLCVEDYSKEFTAEQLRISATGNLYHRSAAGVPAWLVVWSRGATNPAVFTDLASFQSATGQEVAGVTLTGSAPTDSSGRITATGSQFDAAAPAMPPAVSALIGKSATTRHFGAFR